MAQKFVSTYDRINHSRRNSIAVVIGFIIFFALIFALIGLFYGQSVYYDYNEMIMSIIFGALLGVLISLIISVVSYRRSGKILAKAVGAREVSREENPYLYEIVNAIAVGAQITPPKIYIIESGELNAFASGSGGGKSMVAVTRGLMEMLNREELEGVIAHEVAHLKNDDIKFVSLAAALSAALLTILNVFGRSMYFSGGSRRRSESRDSGKGGGGNAIIAIVSMVLSIIAIIVGPIIARAMQSAVSKQREFLADASGAAIIGYPLGLASALEKIDGYNRSYLQNNQSAFTNQSVHALCISQPLAKKVSRLFATHPPIEERVKRLRGM